MWKFLLTHTTSLTASPVRDRGCIAWTPGAAAERWATSGKGAPQFLNIRATTEMMTMVMMIMIMILTMMVMIGRGKKGRERGFDLQKL